MAASSDTESKLQELKTLLDDYKPPSDDPGFFTDQT